MEKNMNFKQANQHNIKHVVKVVKIKVEDMFI